MRLKLVTFSRMETTSHITFNGVNLFSTKNDNNNGIWGVPCEEMLIIYHYNY